LNTWEIRGQQIAPFKEFCGQKSFVVKFCGQTELALSAAPKSQDCQFRPSTNPHQTSPIRQVTENPTSQAVGYFLPKQSFTLLESMRLQPKITFEQYRASYRLIAATKPKATKTRSWQECIVLAVVCLVLGLAPHFPPARTPAFTLYAVLILCWIFCKPLARRSQDRSLRRFYADEQAKLNDQVLTIDESGIACDQGNGQAKSHLTWQAFIRLVDVADAFVFLPSPNTFVRVPKETLTAADQELIRKWSSIVPNINAK
jgi:hypothetical protein